KAEIQLRVRGPSGQPVPGATFQVYRAGTREPMLGQFFQVPAQGGLPTTDENGRMTLVSKGYRTGGFRWWLFWTIPMGEHGRDDDCELTAPGYPPLRFGMSRLFQSPHRYWEDFPKSPQTGLQLYQQEFTLPGGVAAVGCRRLPERSIPHPTPRTGSPRAAYMPTSRWQALQVCWSRTATLRVSSGSTFSTASRNPRVTALNSALTFRHSSARFR